MLTRRALLGGSAMLTAGCSFLDSRFSAPGSPKAKPITWAVTRVSEEELPWLAEQLLSRDEVNPNGPKRGGYALSRQEVGEYLGGDDLVATLKGMEADVVIVDSLTFSDLAKRGMLLPLDGFEGADETSLQRDFYPSVLDQFRYGDSPFALPLNAMPLMMQYDEAFFAVEGVPPPGGSRNWQDLLVAAERLTQRAEDGTVSRWGFVPHKFGIWWALWQNYAEVINPANGGCSLGDTSAIEALEFIRDLFHTHRVSPAAVRRELWDSVYINGVRPAMMHSQSPKPPTGIRLAEIHRGKAQVVPVNAGMAMAILADTPYPELAYTALLGIVDVCQELVSIPAKREAVARLRDFKVGLKKEDIATIQQSMEHGRGVPRFGQTARRALDRILESLARGDDVAIAVNDACWYISQSQ